MEPPKKTSQQQLPSLIWTKFISAEFDSKLGGSRCSFFPEDQYSEVLTSDAIATYLWRDTVAEDAASDASTELVRWIHQKAKKVFAIVAVLKLPSHETIKSMQDFKDEKKGVLDDSKLPIPEYNYGFAPSYFDGDIWDEPRLEHFHTYQWRFLCPVFARKYRYDLERFSIFPFIELDEASTRAGAFSAVYRVTIHEKHTCDSYPQVVAIKEILINHGLDMAKIKAKAKGKALKEEIEKARAEREKRWDIEARALETINNIKHPNIIECLAAIRRGEKRYFMFPWAEGDSLRDFWEQTEEQDPDQNIILQFIQQLRGLADALDHLHNYEDGTSNSDTDEPDKKMPLPQVKLDDETLEYGKTNESIRHGDLKPENILRFPDGQTKLGTLKIADMGLAKRHVVATQDRSALTTTPYSTIRYEAPEARTAIAAQARSRLYDVWSMGCITFEFIVWALYGNTALKTFYKDLEGGTQKVTEYYELQQTETGRKATVHRVVREWIQNIRDKDPECAQVSAIKDLLDLVEEKLLVVQLPPFRKTTLEATGRSLPKPPDTDDEQIGFRATARIFRKGLDKIWLNRNRPGYLVTNSPRPSVKPWVKTLIVIDSTLNPKAAEDRERIPTPRSLEPPKILVADEDGEESLEQSLADGSIRVSPSPVRTMPLTRLHVP